MRGRVGAEPQTEWRRLRFADRPRSRRVRRALCGCCPVDLEHSVQVPGEVDDDAGADSVARHRRPAAAAGDRYLRLAAHGKDRQHVVDIEGLDDNRRENTVIPGVGGVLGTTARIGENASADRFLEAVGDVCGIGVNRSEGHT